MARFPSKEWEEESVTISRKELGEIVTDNIIAVLMAAEKVGDEQLTELIKELLLQFSASISAEIFKPVDAEANHMEIE